MVDGLVRRVPVVLGAGCLMAGVSVDRLPSAGGVLVFRGLVIIAVGGLLAGGVVRTGSRIGQ